MRMNTTIRTTFMLQITIEMPTCFLVQAMEILIPWMEEPSNSYSCYHLHHKVMRKTKLTLVLTIKIISATISRHKKKSWRKNSKSQSGVLWNGRQCLPSLIPRPNHQPSTSHMTQAPKSTILTSTSNLSQSTINSIPELITSHYQSEALSLITIRMEAP